MDITMTGLSIKYSREFVVISCAPCGRKRFQIVFSTNTKINITGTEPRLLYQKDFLKTDLVSSTQKSQSRILLEKNLENNQPETWKRYPESHHFGWFQLQTTWIWPGHTQLAKPLALPTIPAAFATRVCCHSVLPHDVPPLPEAPSLQRLKFNSSLLKNGGKGRRLPASFWVKR